MKPTNDSNTKHSVPIEVLSATLVTDYSNLEPNFVNQISNEQVSSNFNESESQVHTNSLARSLAKFDITTNIFILKDCVNTNSKITPSGELFWSCTAEYMQGPHKGVEFIYNASYEFLIALSKFINYNYNTKGGRMREDILYILKLSKETVCTERKFADNSQPEYEFLNKKIFGATKKEFILKQIDYTISNQGYQLDNFYLTLTIELAETHLTSKMNAKAEFINALALYLDMIPVDFNNGSATSHDINMLIQHANNTICTVYFKDGENVAYEFNELDLSQSENMPVNTTREFVIDGILSPKCSINKHGQEFWLLIVKNKDGITSTFDAYGPFIEALQHFTHVDLQDTLYSVKDYNINNLLALSKGTLCIVKLLDDFEFAYEFQEDPHKYASNLTPVIEDYEILELEHTTTNLNQNNTNLLINSWIDEKHAIPILKINDNFFIKKSEGYLFVCRETEDAIIKARKLSNFPSRYVIDKSTLVSYLVKSTLKLNLIDVINSLSLSNEHKMLIYNSILNGTEEDMAISEFLNNCYSLYFEKS